MIKEKYLALKTTDERASYLHGIAASMIVYIEGLLQKKLNSADKVNWLVMVNFQPKIIDRNPVNEYMICRISRMDIKEGFTGVRWNSIFLSVKEYLFRECNE